MKKAEELREEYNKNRKQEEKIKNIMTNKLKYLGHTVYPTSKDKTEQIKKAGQTAINLCRKFRLIQYLTVFGRSLNLGAFIVAPLRFQMYAFNDKNQVLIALRETQLAMNRYLNSPIKGKACYGPIKKMKGGCINLAEVYVNNMSYYFQKLLTPISSDYYLYIRRILSEVRLDPLKMTMSGRGAWNVAIRTYESIGLKFWANVFTT